MESGLFGIYHKKRLSVFIGIALDIEDMTQIEHHYFEKEFHINAELQQIYEKENGAENLQFKIISIAPEIKDPDTLREFLFLEERFEIAIHKASGWNVLNKIEDGDIYEAKIRKLIWEEASLKPNEIDIWSAITPILILRVEYSSNRVMGTYNDILPKEFFKNENIDLSASIVTLQKAAIANNADAHLAFGKLYQDGLIFEKNLYKAKTYLLLASKNSDTKEEAFERLGDLFSDGILCEKNYDSAIQYYEMSAALGGVYSAHRLGNIYLNKKNNNYDIHKGIQWYEHAYKNGCEFSALELGLLYLNKDEKHIDANYDQAHLWLKRALSTSHDGTAEYELAFLYRDGLGVKQDDEIGAKYIYEALKKGCEDAKYTMGYIYQYGEGVDKNLIRSFAWYLLSESHDSEVISVENQLTNEEIKKAKELSMHLEELISIAREFDILDFMIKRNA